MEAKIDIDNLTDEQQERMCELCEAHVICCSSNTGTYQCEGAFCDSAIEYLIEDIEEDNSGSKLAYKMKLK